MCRVINKILLLPGWVIALFSLLTYAKLLATNPEAKPNKLIPSHVAPGTTQLLVDTAKSIIKWKGTKLNYTGKHEGTLRVKSGILSFRQGRLTGGFITADMRTINVTDIPAHETVPRGDLTTHLHSDFNTSKFPVATFHIAAVTYQIGKISGIAGNLQIKGITRNIKIAGESCCLPQSGYPFFIQFTINRFDWNIGTARSWLEKKLVDKEIQIQVGIVTK